MGGGTLPGDDERPPFQLTLAEGTKARRVLVYALAVFVGIHFGLFGMGLGLAMPIEGAKGLAFVTGLSAVVFGIWMSVILTRSAGKRSMRHAVHVLVGVLVMLIGPILGLLLAGAADPCKKGVCEATYQPLSFPEAFTLVPLQIGAAFAFFLSIRRRERLSAPLEASITTLLLVGIVLHVVLAIQFVKAIPYVLFLLWPVLTPYFALPLLVIELRARLRLRGGEYEPDRLGRALIGVPFVLGLYAVLSALVLGSKTGGVDTFLNTCTWPLSQLPVPPAKDCHYLCTIAAQGEPRLVRPLRWGVRGGKPIVVNRQLAIANAFEDLLHERWPRFGRWARALYDRLAFPISSALTRRWLANVLYVAMKPAELLFFLTLLFFDPGDPEHRIDRMYR